VVTFAFSSIRFAALVRTVSKVCFRTNTVAATAIAENEPVVIKALQSIDMAQY
jgi:hypothetical protein